MKLRQIKKNCRNAISHAERVFDVTSKVLKNRDDYYSDDGCIKPVGSYGCSIGDSIIIGERGLSQVYMSMYTKSGNPPFTKVTILDTGKKTHFGESKLTFMVGRDLRVHGLVSENEIGISKGMYLENVAKPLDQNYQTK